MADYMATHPYLALTPPSQWYATFAALAGEDPTDVLAASSGLPPIDSLDVWPLISGANATSPRMLLPLDASSIIVGDWKLLLGSVGESGWTGYVYPNASTAAGARIDGKHNCGELGCLFNVVEDQGACAPCCITL